MSPCQPATTTGLPVALLKPAMSLAKRRHVVAWTADRHVDLEQIGCIGVGDHGQDLAEQAVIREQRGREIDRIGGGGERLAGSCRAWRAWSGSNAHHFEAGKCRRIGAHDAGGAAARDGDEAAAGWLPALEIELGGRDQVGDILRAPDADALQGCVDHSILVGERAGMRLRGALAGSRATRFQRDDGDAVWRARSRRASPADRAAGCPRDRAAAT